MTQPVTYYVQIEPIEQLTEKYGSRLERLTRPQKLLLLALIVDTISNRLLDFRIAHCEGIEVEFVKECIHLIEASSQRQQEGLMLALATQLHDNVYAEDK